MREGGQPAQLLQAVRNWLAAVRVHDLVLSGPLAAVEQELAESRGERLDVADDPLLVVLLAGPTAVGKSSLINALAGANISPVGLGATTSAPVLFVHREDDVERLSDYGDALLRLASDGANLVRHDRRELEHTVLVDTPDIDSVRRRHREVTEGLVHCADLILFVTTPETYKTVESARWIAAQRGQRGMAFVMNKWDQEAIGRGYRRRGEVLQDFRALLAAEGFVDPVIFLSSTLKSGTSEDNQFGALRDWLTEGLQDAAAQALSARRRRAAWRRLATAMTEAMPRSMADTPEVKEIFHRLSQARDRSLRLISLGTAGASGLAEERHLPELPGLLGSYLRLGERFTGVARRLRGAALGSTAKSSGVTDQESTPLVAGAAFAIVAGTTEKIARDARTARLPLGGVGSQWASSLRILGDRLSVLPATVEANLFSKSRRLSFRRLGGIGVLSFIEITIVLVVLTVLWRTGEGFVVGVYAPVDLALDAGALVVALLLLGQFSAGLFFPRLRTRFNKAVETAAKHAFTDTWQEIESALATQVEASARLRSDGRALLREIESIGILPRLTPAGDDEIQGLFPAVLPDPESAALEPEEHRWNPR